MKPFGFNQEKSQQLKQRYGISFEELIVILNHSKSVIANIQHPNQKKYPGQMMLVVAIGHYVYGIPYVEDEKKRFLKTLFPSRKLKKLYVQKKGEQYEKENA